MNIWHISDTHGFHQLLKIPKNIDMVIHSGDFTNSNDIRINRKEMHNFFEWFTQLEIPIKILIAGNHDTIAYRYKKEILEIVTNFKIIYLENSHKIIEGIKIWGSPYTPRFGNWSFMKKREKLNQLWETIPEDTDIVVTHGPPKGALDLSYSREHILEHCGCRALRNHIIFRVKPKYSLFGHIHNNKDILNAGTVKYSNFPTIYSNGSVVTDGKFGLLSSNGNILKYE